MTIKTAIKKLKEIQLDTETTALMSDVIDTTINELDGYTKAEDYFQDLSHGCSSGMIGELIYYKDTHAFYDKHYSDIEDLREEYKENTGVALEPQGDLKNWYAWLAFEETSRTLAQKIGIEV